jgi:hypothetical protein
MGEGEGEGKGEGKGEGEGKGRSREHRSSRRSVAPSASRRRLASESSAKQPSDPMRRDSSPVAPGRSEPSSPHSMPPAATPAAAPAVAAASARRRALDLRLGEHGGELKTSPLAGPPSSSSTHAASAAASGAATASAPAVLRARLASARAAAGVSAARRCAGDEAGLAHLPPARLSASSARRCDEAIRGCDEAGVEAGVSCRLGAAAASAAAAGMAAAASHMCAAGPSGVSRHQGSGGWLHTRCPGSGRAAAAWVRVADLRQELLLTSLAGCGSSLPGLVPWPKPGTGCNEEMAHALDGRPSTRSSRLDEPCGLGSAANRRESCANGCGPTSLRCGLTGRAPCWLHRRNDSVLLLGGRRWALLAGELTGRGIPEAGRGHCVRVDADRLVARLAADAMATLTESAGDSSAEERSRSFRHIPARSTQPKLQVQHR